MIQLLGLKIRCHTLLLGTGKVVLTLLRLHKVDLIDVVLSVMYLES